MTCDVGSSGGEDLPYVWYKDGNWISAEKIYTIRSTNTWDSGDYSCQAGTKRSDTARLDVVFDLVILQVPLNVHEGDDLTLRCHHRSDYTGKYTKFYKEDSVIQNWSETSEFHVGIVNMINIGRYKCTKAKPWKTLNTYITYTDEAFISIHNLFKIPEIKVTPYPVVEGDEMTLTCDTSLSPLRPRTQLKFAFHKDERNVREFTSYNQYGVQSAQMKDSGKYSCEVTTAANSVKKRSPEILVKIKELFINPTIKAIRYPGIEGDNMTLICNTSLSPLRQRTELQFAFYRDGRNVQEFSSSDQYEVQSIQLEDSGNYSCDVRASNGKVRKSSHFILIMIKELFFIPVINISTFEVLKGDNMTLTCNTSLSPLRQRTKLQFAFYSDGQNVQEFSLYNHYDIHSAQLEDSGNYSCEVRSTSNISKRSDNVLVQIRGKKDADYTLQNILRLLASGIIILIGAFIFYTHMKTVRISKTKNVEDAEERVEEQQL
ncbi:Fc receptor-like protein 5 [Aquarana catesbeiana]|uniref:Fc receptor-like protein 5 n=1 Tax=Aquarana catesbeiana TaxID=8400 RepID=UPI003CC9D50A